MYTPAKALNTLLFVLIYISRSQFWISAVTFSNILTEIIKKKKKVKFKISQVNSKLINERIALADRIN